MISKRTNSAARLYFDYAASTPVDPRVERAMRPYLLAQFGNPGSLHRFGQEAMAAVDASRETLARLIGADFRQVVFTGSATEANNLALRGAVAAWREAHPGAAGGRPRIVVSAIEHESVLETAHGLERDGVEMVVVPVDRSGVVDMGALRTALNERTVLVSVMYANNEIGTIQPVREIAAFTAAARGGGGRYPLFHTDAVQAFQFLDCDVRAIGADLMTLSAHKIYGPKGIGLLYARDAARDLRPVIVGGGQEFGVRSGTENVPLIVGFARAAEIASGVREKEGKRLAALRARLWSGIKKTFPHAEMNGTGPALPNILNVSFPGRSAEDILVKLDLAGVAVSSGSACQARAATPSHVVAALGHPSARARGSIRFSLGRPTTAGEIVKLFIRLRGI